MRINYITLILGAILLTACNESESTSNYAEVQVEESSFEEESNEKAEEYIDDSSDGGLINADALSVVYGDLNKDGIDEMAEVIETGVVGEYGNERALNIYKKNKDNSWGLWYQSTTVILSSESGGMMGDPFEDIEIANGTIIVYHFGGSSWKWSYTHRFRFQNSEFELIGATTTYGKLCEEWEDVDFNVSTGKINYSYSTEMCDGEGIEQSTSKVKKTYQYKFDKLPKITNFIPGQQKVPVTDEEGEEVELYF